MTLVEAKLILKLSKLPMTSQEMALYKQALATVMAAAFKGDT